jgi:two-component system chemotaxis sensor kinase CheA
VTFFPDERAAELRDLFFESSQDLLQELNEAGILLETNPADSSALARVRRAMHTLKGDAAACGYQPLSELAHHLEDLFTAEQVQSRGSLVAEIILSAADTFHAMLAAYRGNLQPPDASELRAYIQKLMEAPGTQAEQPASVQVKWLPEERARILEAIRAGQSVYHLVLQVDSTMGMPAAALQLVNRALDQCGKLLAVHPQKTDSLRTLSQVDAAISGSSPADWIRQRCAIPGVVAGVTLHALTETAVEARDALEVLLEAEASAEARTLGIADPGGPDLPEEASSSKNASGLISAEAWLRVEASRVDTVMNLLGELIIGKSMLHRAVNEFERRFPKDALRNPLGDALSFQSRVLNELQKAVMKIRMVPLEQLFRRLPRLVRDVAKIDNKEITIEMSGQNTDLDKSVLDALAEPLAHIVRNAADHGIESPQERLARGKPALGTIYLNAFHQGNQVVIVVRDDGRGIDRDRLVRRAIEMQLITEDEAARLTHTDALQLIFKPGLSTARQLTNISGRGVGMDVVLNVVHRLKGRVVVESEPGRGTSFQIIMPLTLASIQALMFRVGGQLYAVPLDAVHEISRADEKDIHDFEGQEVLRLRDKAMGVVRLEELFGEDRRGMAKARHFVVVIGTGSRRFGLLVDSLVGEEELVIKSLEDRLVASELVSGASILGDGTVVLILNIPAVVSHLGRRAAEKVLA